MELIENACKPVLDLVSTRSRRIVRLPIYTACMCWPLSGILDPLALELESFHTTLSAHNMSLQLALP